MSIAVVFNNEENWERPESGNIQALINDAFTQCSVPHEGENRPVAPFEFFRGSHPYRHGNRATQDPICVEITPLNVLTSTTPAANPCAAPHEFRC